jgi:FKBP-type peptidyl-prolyl cis-trans isomerase FkpA
MDRATHEIESRGATAPSSGVCVILPRVLRSTFVVAALAATVSAASCTDTPTAPSNYAGYSSTDLRVGTGGDAVTGRLLTVNYTGWLYNSSRPENKGAIFDTTEGGTPFTFTLGAGLVIEGWDQGTAGMRVGGLRRLVIPPSLAYGSIRNGAIPPNATLLFEIELLEVQ